MMLNQCVSVLTLLTQRGMVGLVYKGVFIVYGVCLLIKITDSLYLSVHAHMTFKSVSLNDPVIVKFTCIYVQIK